jgi:hypothetical protein
LALIGRMRVVRRVLQDPESRVLHTCAALPLGTAA